MPDIYLDHNATTAIRPEIIDLMASVMAHVGNASSVHTHGRKARAAVEKARGQVAVMAGSLPEYVTFNGGATEANNSVLAAFRGEMIMIGATEHPSVREAANAYAADVITIPVDENGIIDENEFVKLVTENKPAIISVMRVNSETGVIQDIASLARAARRAHGDVFFHTDAVQAAGKIPIDMGALGVDYLSLSAHKCGGPQGVGALICAPGSRPAKFIYGGGQERRQRAGTENVAGIAGFGLAAEMAAENMADYQKLEALRDDLETQLTAINPDIRIFGQNASRVANTCCLSPVGITAQTALMALDLKGVCISSGSACSSGTLKPSKVLAAMGASDDELQNALRVSLGWDTTQSDIDGFVIAWSKIIERVQNKTAQA